MIEKLLEAFISFFVIIEPFGLVPIFLMITKEYDKSRRKKIAVKATLIAAIVLTLFGFVGDLLHYLKVSDQAFRIAGGILLFIISIDMVIGEHSGIRSTTEAEEKEAFSRGDVSVFPLAIPLIAGPGALTTVVLIMRQNRSEPLTQGLIIVILLMVLLLTFLCMLLATPLSRLLGITGSNVIGRISGILLAAIAVQLIIDGITLSFFVTP